MKLSKKYAMLDSVYGFVHSFLDHNRFSCPMNQDRRTLNCVHKKFYSCLHYNFSELPGANNAGFESSEIGKLLGKSTNTINVSGLQDLLQICAEKNSIAVGKCCHALAIAAGILTDTLTCNILINMYSKCGDVSAARLVFGSMAVRSIVSWNTMIAAHSHLGEHTEALELFACMHQGGTSVSEFTLSSVLCASAARFAVVESKQLHALSIKISMDSHVFVGTALLDVYAKCNKMTDARHVFDKLPEKSPVTWSSMVAGYVQNDLHEEALKLFRRTHNLGVELTQFTLSAVLGACASLAAIIEGTQLHATTIRTGFDSNLYVSTSIIDVYSKCGLVEEAYTIFADIEEKNSVLWNAMIAGFSRHAHSSEAMILFEKMQQMGMYPNEITYISILSSCGHAGLVEEGRCYFDLMLRDKNVQPNVLHYSCMVDILGRAGLIYEAWELIEKMPFKATASMWGSLLGSCRIHGDTTLAKVAAEHLFEIEPSNAGNHVLLSNIYAAKKEWGEVAMARKLLKDSGVKKEMGKSWIEVKNRVHVFVVGERNHSRIAEIYAKLEDLGNEMKKLAYHAMTDCDLHDVEEDKKEVLLRHHSEKLALAFGLISLPSGVPIRIKKNLRICRDCHSFLKFASMNTGREIIVRDTNRFHHFSSGLCSCGDFW